MTETKPIDTTAQTITHEANARIADLVGQIIRDEAFLTRRTRSLLAAIARWASELPEEQPRIQPPPPKRNGRSSATQPLPGVE